MKKLLLHVLVLMIAFTACNSKKEKKSPEKIESLSDLKDYTENVKDKMDESQKKIEERKKRGDTIAMNYKDLQAYLPDIPGYEKDGGPGGESMNGFGGSWSTASQKYKNGDKNIKVEIVDYNAAYQTFAGLTALYGMGFSREDDNEKIAAVDLGVEGVQGYETISKKEPNSKLTIVIAGRFITNIECNGSNDSEFLKSIAKGMKLSDLASK
ncbi:MAG: hypothetical protein EKK37_06170 [Sphingobacteriales bacterium]|nr:MAG: hypothetical protein EKK37_06170 [Sphingobacteriales bacterium]